MAERIRGQGAGKLDDGLTGKLLVKCKQRLN